MTNRPAYRLSIDRPIKEWLTDPGYSLDSFLQDGGRQAVVELMRKYVEIPGPYGLPAGLSYYREFLGFRQRLTADEREAAEESWNRKRGGKAPSFREYVLSFSDSDATDTHDKGSEGSPAPNDGTVVEGAACTLLAQSFAALLADGKRRFCASLDYTKPVKRLGFLAGFRLYFRIKAKLRGLTDDEIHVRILDALAEPESKNNNNQ